jgi:hypothetical protein
MDSFCFGGKLSIAMFSATCMKQDGAGDINSPTWAGASLAQGVQTGQNINAALQPAIPIEGGFQAVAEHVHDAVDVAGPIVSAWSEASKLGFTVARLRAALVAATPEILFNLVVMVAIWGPRRDAFFSEVVAGRLEQVRESLASNGASDNLELFMAVCADSQHESLSSDVVTDLGVWHGLFRLDFTEAQADGAAHEHPTAVRIHRYQTATS